MFQKLYEKMKQFPIVAVFFLFLFCFTILDMLWPKRERSDLENRELAQLPEFSIKSVLAAKDTWMSQYAKYTQDQIAFRDSWIDIKSRAENMLMKTENNGVWLGKDHYLFAKFMNIGSRFESNLNAVKRMAERHPGMVDVMIVPSASNILTEKLPWRVPIADEDAAHDTIAQTLDGTARVFDLRDTLRSHAQEYIYYRTDHHWTTEGAYLAYQEYATAKGLVPFDCSKASKKQVSDFYGTNFSKARPWDAVADTITYYDLPNQLTIYSAKPDGSETAEPGPLYNDSDFKTRDKYRAFLRGNNGYSVLEGNGEGNILVVKDSYANAFIPYLTANYKTIGIVDFRFWNEKIDSLIERGNYDEVLVLYSFQGFMDAMTLASKIATP